jgi:hypothetical protein
MRKSIVALIGALMCLASGAAAQINEDLVGHWRETQIGYVVQQDTHLVLDEEGNADTWTVTATQRSEVTSGTWSSNGKMLTLKFEREQSSPFTFYKGQLVFPNIQNRRRFWDRIE